MFSKPFKENVTVSLQDEYRALKPLFGTVAGYGIFILAQTLGLVQKGQIGAVAVTIQYYIGTLQTRIIQVEHGVCNS